MSLFYCCISIKFLWWWCYIKDALGVFNWQQNYFTIRKMLKLIMMMICWWWWSGTLKYSGDDKDWFSNLGAKPRPSSFKSNAGMYVTCKTEFEKGLDIWRHSNIGIFVEIQTHFTLVPASWMGTCFKGRSLITCCIFCNSKFWLFPTWPFWRKLAIFKHVGNGQNLRIELMSVHQTIQGGPSNVLDKSEPNRSYQSHFPTWYSKLGHFTIEIPIKNEKG